MEKGPGIEPSRIVAISFFFAAVVLGIFLEKVLGLVFSYTRWNDAAMRSEVLAGISRSTCPVRNRR